MYFPRLVNTLTVGNIIIVFFKQNVGKQSGERKIVKCNG